MNQQPIDLQTALNSFDSYWDPRIVTQVNDYDVRIAKVVGEFIWHVHEDTDEFFMVLDGELSLGLRDGEPGTERAVTLSKGAVFVVPRGVEHRPSSAAGAAILMFEPTGTVNTGEWTGEVPDHIVASTGRPLG